MASGFAPLFTAFPAGTSHHEIAKSALALVQPFASVHQQLFPPAQPASPDAEAEVRWHFFADVDAPLAAAQSKDALARRVIHAISTCLEFRGVGKIGEAAHRVLVLDGGRTDSHSCHVYVFIDPAARASFASSRDLQAFAEEVNGCVGAKVLDLLIYRAGGALRLPFSWKTYRRPDGSQTRCRLAPLQTSDPWLAGQMGWVAESSEVDIIAACLEARIDGPRVAQFSDVDLTATTVPTAARRDMRGSPVDSATDGSEPLCYTVEQRRAALAELEALVERLPDEAAEPFAIWRRVFFAIRTTIASEVALAADGLRVFDTFSARCPAKYNPRTVRRFFGVKLLPAASGHDIHFGQRVLRTLIRDCHRHGWLTDADVKAAGAQRGPEASRDWGGVDPDRRAGAPPERRGLTLAEGNKAADEWLL